MYRVNCWVSRDLLVWLRAILVSRLKKRGSAEGSITVGYFVKAGIDTILRVFAGLHIEKCENFVFDIGIT